jgi:hypothetical protein
VKKGRTKLRQNGVYPSLACGELFANFKETPLIYFPRRQKKKKKKYKRKVGDKKNGPIKHKSTVLHVFRARLARLSRLHRTEWRVPNAYLIFGRGAAES